MQYRRLAILALLALTAACIPATALANEDALPPSDDGGKGISYVEPDPHEEVGDGDGDGAVESHPDMEPGASTTLCPGGLPSDKCCNPNDCWLDLGADNCGHPLWCLPEDWVSPFEREDGGDVDPVGDDRAPCEAAFCDDQPVPVEGGDSVSEPCGGVAPDYMGCSGERREMHQGAPAQAGSGSGTVEATVADTSGGGAHAAHETHTSAGTTRTTRAKRQVKAPARPAASSKLVALRKASPAGARSTDAAVTATVANAADAGVAWSMLVPPIALLALLGLVKLQRTARSARCNHG